MIDAAGYSLALQPKNDLIMMDLAEYNDKVREIIDIPSGLGHDETEEDFEDIVRSFSSSHPETVFRLWVVPNYDEEYVVFIQNGRSYMTDLQIPPFDPTKLRVQGVPTFNIDTYYDGDDVPVVNVRTEDIEENSKGPVCRVHLDDRLIWENPKLEKNDV